MRASIWHLFLCACFTSHNTMIPISTHVATNGEFSFFLWLSNISLCKYTHSLYPCIHEEHDIFSRNTAVINVGVKASSSASDFISWRYISHSRIAGLHGSLCVFFQISIMFSILVILIYISINSK